ncbi:MAG: hypothetical protein GEU99_20795 [Luteitalea sp.]|nr:hypothetical protein [Luteitalea sp.]
MASAAKLGIVERGRAALRVRHDVMEFEEPAFRASPSPGAHERTLAAVALPDGPLHRGRDVPRSHRRAAPVLRPVRGRVLRLGTVGDEERQGPIEDDRGIAGGDGVPEERLGLLQLRVGLRADGERHLVARGRQRRDHGWACRGRRGRRRTW